jgi:hypothetical protein
LRLTHFDVRHRWKTTNLPTKVWAAVTEALNLLRASFFSASVGATCTAAVGLVTAFCLAW